MVKPARHATPGRIIAQRRKAETLRGENHHDEAAISVQRHISFGFRPRLRLRAVVNRGLGGCLNGCDGRGIPPEILGVDSGSALTETFAARAYHYFVRSSVVIV